MFPLSPSTQEIVESINLFFSFSLIIGACLHSKPAAILTWTGHTIVDVSDCHFQYKQKVVETTASENITKQN